MPLFLVFHPFCFVYFQAQNLHFAPFGLSRLAASSLFFAPNYRHLAPKIPLFNEHFALFGHVFNGSNGFCLYHCCGYLCFSSYVQHHFTLHLAPFCSAFCTKTQCIQHQNAVCLAPKRSVFSTKMQCIQRQIVQNLVQMAVFLNKNSFCSIHRLPPFCVKINLRENRFFAARRAIGEQKGYSQC